MSTSEIVTLILTGLGLLGSFLAWIVSFMMSVRREMSSRMHEVNNRLHNVEGRVELLMEDRHYPPPRKGPAR